MAVKLEYLEEDKLAELMESVSKGPPKWHSKCGRKHRSRVPCDLVEAERTAKSGNIVTRLVHKEMTHGDTE